MGDNHIRTQPSQLPPESPHHPRVETESTQPALRNPQLQVCVQDNRFFSEQCQYEVLLTLRVKMVDQGPGVTLCTPGLIEWQNMENGPFVRGTRRCY